MYNLKNIFLLILFITITISSLKANDEITQIKQTNESYGKTSINCSFLKLNDKEKYNSLIGLTILRKFYKGNKLIESSIFYPLNNDCEYQFLLKGRFAETSQSTILWGDFKTRTNGGVDLSIFSINEKSYKNQDFIDFGTGLRLGLELAYKNVCLGMQFGPHIDTRGKFYNLYQISLGWTLNEDWMN